MAKKEVWTKEKIASAFKHYIDLYGHMPSAHEIDDSDLFPTARQIQRKFGGLEAVRGFLGYSEINLSKGKNRSRISEMVGKRGRIHELDLEKALVEHFGEYFVHSEKRYGESGARIDFYVYSPEGDFGVDVFETKRIDDLHNNLNSKFIRYKDFSYPLYFVIANNQIWKQEELNRICSGKKHMLSQYRVMSLIDFTRYFQSVQKYCVQKE